MSRDRIQNSGLFNQVVDGGADTPEIDSPTKAGMGAFSSAKLSYESEAAGVLPNTGINVSANIVHIIMQREQSRQLGERQEVTREMFREFSPGALFGALGWDLYQFEMSLKMPYVSNAARNAGDKEKLIVVVDRYSTAETVAEQLKKQLGIDASARVAMIDEDTTVASRNKIIEGFLGLGEPGAVYDVVVVPSGAVQEGYFRDMASLMESLDNQYGIIMFDTLKNFPSAVTDYAELFRSSGGQATQIDYFAVSESDGSDEEPPFYS